VGNTMSESLYLIDNRRDKHGQSLSISSLTCLGDKKECLSRRGSATNSFFFGRITPVVDTLTCRMFLCLSSSPY